MQSFLSTSALITLLTLSSPFLSLVHAAKPSSLTSSSAAATATGSSSKTDSLGSTGSSSGSFDSGAWSQSSSSSSSASSSSSTASAKSQWIQINTPMGKITSCSTIMLSWSFGGVDGPLEIDLVSATTGDIITVQSGIDLTKGTTSYKWTVAAPADTYYLQGNAADFPSLIYSGNFTVSQGSSTNCVNKQAVSSSASAASGSARASATASATPSSGATFVSGAERVVASGLSVAGLAIFAAFCL